MTNVGGSRRAAEALNILAASSALLAAELDAAEIPHWRERIADAIDLDEREQGVRHGRNYDLTMRLLRDELGRVPLPVEPAADVADRRTFPDRQERKYDPDDPDQGAVLMLPTFAPDPYVWPVRDDPAAPWWYRGHDVWNRDYGRRFWPVLGRCVKRSRRYPPARSRRPR